MDELLEAVFKIPLFIVGGFVSLCALPFVFIIVLLIICGIIAVLLSIFD